MMISRIIRTGIAFGTFFVGALVLVCGPFLFLQIIPFKKDKKEVYARSMIRLSFRFFVALMRGLGLIHKPIIKGIETNIIGKSCIYVANHPSLIDVVLLGSVLPDATCIVKHAHWENFFLGGVMKAAGYIPNIHGPQLLAECQNAFDRGISLMIFPEGTRSTKAGMGSFKRGTARLLFGSEATVIPIIITCYPRTLMKHQKWYEIPGEKVKYSIHFMPQMEIPNSIETEPQLPKKVRAFTKYMEEYFREQINIQKSSTSINQR